MFLNVGVSEIVQFIVRTMSSPQLLSLKVSPFLKIEKCALTLFSNKLNVDHVFSFKIPF